VHATWRNANVRPREHDFRVGNYHPGIVRKPAVIVQSQVDKGRKTSEDVSVDFSLYFVPPETSSNE